MTSAHENAMSDLEANNHTQKYPVTCEHGNYQACYFCEHARAAQLEAERDNYKDAAHDWHMNYIDAIATNNELRAKLEQAQRDLAECRAEVERLEPARG